MSETQALFCLHWLLEDRRAAVSSHSGNLPQHKQAATVAGFLLTAIEAEEEAVNTRITIFLIPERQSAD